MLDRELPLSEVAAREAAAVDVQIALLRLRRALLTAVAARTPTTPEELGRMHQLARLTTTERRRLVEEFLDAVFDERPAHAGIRRSLTPELPDDPTQEQADAWVALAELSLDPDFRAALRRLAETGPDFVLPHVVALAHRHAGPALAAGIAPDSAEAVPALAALTADAGRQDLLTCLELADDPRRDRYLHLLAVINGWPAPVPHSPVIRWSVAALRARAA